MLYTVGEMAKVLGVPASTLRYYDNEGILPCVERSSGGIRMFTDKDYEWLKIIECLKKSGLSIKEIKLYIDMIGRGDRSLQERLELFRSRKQAVQKQINDLEETLRLLEYKCWYYEEALKDGTDKKVSALSIGDIPEPHRSTKEKINIIHSQK